ncbi:MAG: methionyl-tRNA formyltransferase [bacterium]
MDINTIFMGTPEFAAVSLKAVCEAGIKVSAVVTQPDRPQGRGNLMIPSAVKRVALDCGMPVFQPRRAEEIVDELEAMAPDFILVVAFGQILRSSVLDIPRKCCINVHASLLPAYRGASPINRAIINGEMETGVTTMALDEGMDTGDILLVEKTAILPEDTASELHDRLAESGARLLIETILNFDSITPLKQDSSRATIAAKLTKDSGRLDWSKSGTEIRNLIRGCNPWPSAFTFHQGKMVKIWEARIKESGRAPIAEPGDILRVDSAGIEVAVGDGSVVVTEIQREGKKRMPACEYLRGCTVCEGEKFDRN